MNHRVKLYADPDDVIDKNRIIQEWMVEENNRMREENILRTAREDGRLEGIQEGKELKEIEFINNMLNEGIEYDIIAKITEKTVEDIKDIEKELEVWNI